MKNFLKSILTLDTVVYLKIHSLNKNKSLNVFMKYLTHLGTNYYGFVYGVILLALYYFKDYKNTDHLIVSIIVSQTIVIALKRFFNRARPYKAMVLKSVINPPKCTNSFPSSHTAIAFTTALGWSFLFPSLMAIFLVIGVLIGLSRIVLGYHYPVDVIFGAAIATLVHCLTMLY